VEGTAPTHPHQYRGLEEKEERNKRKKKLGKEVK
jgi:hypothetical protein